MSLGYHDIAAVEVGVGEDDWDIIKKARAPLIRDFIGVSRSSSGQVGEPIVERFDILESPCRLFAVEENIMNRLSSDITCTLPVRKASLREKFW